jgi:uncharacterized protein with HEPN domain
VPSRDPVQRFEDILQNIARIERFTAGMNFAAFSQNEQALFAVNHALLIISEAAVKLGDLAAQLCPEIPWPEVKGLGNRLRHDYDNINIVRIWLVVEKDLAPLKAAAQGGSQSDRRWCGMKSLCGRLARVQGGRRRRRVRRGVGRSGHPSSLPHMDRSAATREATKSDSAAPQPTRSSKLSKAPRPDRPGGRNHKHPRRLLP